MEIKNNLTVTIGLEGGGIWGKEGKGSSRNMYKEPLDKAKGGEGLRVRSGGGWSGESGGGNMETTVLEQQ